MITTMPKAISCKRVSAVSARKGLYRDTYFRLSPDFIM